MSDCENDILNRQIFETDIHSFVMILGQMTFFRLNAAGAKWPESTLPSKVLELGASKYTNNTLQTLMLKVTFS